MNHERPIANSYWVIPGKFLAGEYPGSREDSAARAKLNALRDDGVTHFVDLTELGEGLAPYHHLLASRGGSKVSALRFPIPDMSTPTSRDLVVDILDHIDLVLAAGGVVYLHCWGGVGRTGTIVGCWLARHGHKGREALERLGELWSRCPKSHWRSSPETDEQMGFIVNWNEFG